MAYNGAQAVGWGCVLVRAVGAMMTVGTTTVYETCRTTLMTFQLLSFAEVMHAAMGVTKSPTSAALMQWAGRTHCLKCALDSVRSSHGTPAATALILAWAMTEVIRYPSYVGSLVGVNPKWLDVAAVHGVRAAVSARSGAEMKLMYDARAYARKTKMYAIEMPNAFNFAFDYPSFLNGLLVVYPFLFYSLYAYMFAQRRKSWVKARRNKTDRFYSRHSTSTGF